jgi:hypothetical protein
MNTFYLLSILFPLSFIFSAKIYDRDMVHLPKMEEALLKRGHTLVNSLDDCDLIPYWAFAEHLDEKYRKKAILHTYEPPLHFKALDNMDFLNSFLKVYSWRHDLAEINPLKFKKFFYPQYYPIDYKNFKPFKKRKFACLINSYIHINYPNELYSKRKQIALFYNKNFPKLLSVYGRNGFKEFKLKVYKGVIDDKNQILKDHKFCYCYENWDNDYHYITEKILHCITNLCVPIYLGSKNITDYIPEDVFIDARKFKSIKEIHDYISNMDEDTWNSYIQAMKRFDESKKSTLFTVEKQVENLFSTILEALEELGL